MIETSCIARALTEEEVKRVAARYLPERTFLSFDPLSGGLFNNTVRMEFADAPPVVLRAGPVNRNPLLPFEMHLMASEVHVDRLCEAAGIPCSHLLAVDTTKTLLDRDFMLVDCMDGVALSDPTVPEVEKPALYRETGRLLAKFHGITGPSFGRVWAVCDGQGTKTWTQALLREVVEVCSKCRSAGLFDGTFLEDVNTLFVNNTSLFDDVLLPCLVHADLWEGNVLVRQEETGWRVAAIIDGDRAYFGDPDYDLATPWMTTPAFFAGYGGHPPESPERQKKLGFYRLLMDLTDAYVWQAEYQNKENYQDKKLDAEKKFQALLNL